MSGESSPASDQGSLLRCRFARRCSIPNQAGASQPGYGDQDSFSVIDRFSRFDGDFVAERDLRVEGNVKGSIECQRHPLRRRRRDRCRQGHRREHHRCRRSFRRNPMSRQAAPASDRSRAGPGQYGRPGDHGGSHLRRRAGDGGRQPSRRALRSGRWSFQRRQRPSVSKLPRPPKSQPLLPAPSFAGWAAPRRHGTPIRNPIQTTPDRPIASTSRSFAGATDCWLGPYKPDVLTDQRATTPCYTRGVGTRVVSAVLRGAFGSCVRAIRFHIYASTLERDDRGRASRPGSQWMTGSVELAGTLNGRRKQDAAGAAIPASTLPARASQFLNSSFPVRLGKGISGKPAMTSSLGNRAWSRNRNRRSTVHWSTMSMRFCREVVR